MVERLETKIIVFHNLSDRSDTNMFLYDPTDLKCLLFAFMDTQSGYPVELL